MPIDSPAAANFIWSAARLVDRHRYSMLFAEEPAEPVIDALRGAITTRTAASATRWSPTCAARPASRRRRSMRSRSSTRLARRTARWARDARGWIASIAELDGGIPSVLPGFEQYPHAPWFQPASGSVLTLALAAALHAGGVTDGAWLDRATNWCWRSIETAEQPGGYWLKYACAFLDAAPDEHRARAAVESLTTRVDPTAIVPVGGVEGEALRPLDLSPRPGSRSRGLVSEAQVEAHLDSSSQNSSKTVAGCSTGLPGRRRRRPTGAATSRFAR